MKTNFFESLVGMETPGNWNLSIEVPENGTIKVSALYRPLSCGDNAHKLVPPLMLAGTAAEVDEGFFEAITEPIKQASGLYVGMEGYLKGLEKAKTNSKMIADQKNKVKNSGETGGEIEIGEQMTSTSAGPSKEEKRKAYDQTMKQIDELKGRLKYDQALELVPSAEEYPEKEVELKKLVQDLNRFKEQLSFFNQD